MVSKMTKRTLARRRGYWFTTEKGQHLFAEEGETPKEACERYYAERERKEEKTEELRRKVEGRTAKEATDVVQVDMSTDFQKQFETASPRERQKLAFNYIMDYLRGDYEAEDGRVVSIERVGADKMTHIHYEAKLQATPELANFIKRGKFLGEIDVNHKKFEKMAYYKITFSLGADVYDAKLNVGIRKNGRCTLYDLNPINKT